MKQVTVVGGGLAGCEASLQLADRGLSIKLIEMRPAVSTGAHRSGSLAEIVCSNSFKSTLLETASGLLKAELEVLGSRLLPVARDSSVPAGHALAVDREVFSAHVTKLLEGHPLVDIVRKRQDDLELDTPAIVATGPLTDEQLLSALERHFSAGMLYFYDAISPSVERDSMDAGSGFWASRYGKGTADYWNIPLDEEQYLRLLSEIRGAELLPPHPFEEEKYFEACLPIEVIAARGEETLRFGPLKPRGLLDPKTGQEPYAVVQLRHESRDGSMLGLVGFQTRMTRSSQRRVVRSIPGLARAEILRYGAIHKNAFFNTPSLCWPYQRDRKRGGLFFAGQICGLEGYVECLSSGLVAALSVIACLEERPLPPLPDETMLGSLMRYIHTPNQDFQPMNANLGIMPLKRVGGKRKERRRKIAEEAIGAMKSYRRANPWLFGNPAGRGLPPPGAY